MKEGLAESLLRVMQALQVLGARGQEGLRRFDSNVKSFFAMRFSELMKNESATRVEYILSCAVIFSLVRHFRYLRLQNV